MIMMKLMLPKNEKGFTLIELMIVVAIVGILASVALPSFLEQIQKSRRSDVMDALTDCAAVQARNFSAESPPTYLTNAALGTSGLCNGRVSKDGYYSLTVTNPSCTTSGSTWCFVITATAIAAGQQSKDTDCATWTIDHRGRKTAANSASADTTNRCWRK